MPRVTPLARAELAELEPIFEIIEETMGFVPNQTTGASFESLRRHFLQQQIVERAAVVSLFGWLDRWNDTMATELEQGPLAFASGHLGAHGWQVGKHRST